MSPASMPTGFFHSNGLTQNWGRPWNFPSEISLSHGKIGLRRSASLGLTETGCYYFTASWKIQALLKMLFPNLVCAHLAVLRWCCGVRFYSLPLSHMKRPRGCEQQTVSPAEPLVSVQDKISARSGRALCGFSPCPKISFHGTCISIFSILLAYAFF